MANTNRLIVTLSDGTQKRVQTTLEDRLAFETALRKNKRWGKLEENSMKLLPFMAWNALRRKDETELTWDEFTTGDTAALSVEPEPDADEEDDELEVPGMGKDTQPAPSTKRQSRSRTSSAAPHGNGEEKSDPS